MGQDIKKSKNQGQKRRDYPTSRVPNKFMSTGMKCANCGKGVMYGHNVSHAKNRTRKIFKPNLHSARIVTAGIGKRVRLCTKCLRMTKKKMQAKQTILVAQTVSQASV